LPTMKPGDIFSGEFTLTNYGLVRADSLRFTLPASDNHFRYELLSTVPASLGAHEVARVAYRLTSLESFPPSGTASGGGCSTYQPTADANWSFLCANGTPSDGASSASFLYSSGGDCGGGGGGGGGGGPVFVFNPGGSGDGGVVNGGGHPI